MHIVPRLPRKSGGAHGTPEGRQRDAKAYIRPLGNAHCPTPATQKLPSPRGTRGTPEGRQGVHQTPWQCTLSHACHAKAAEPKGHQRDARGTSDPLAMRLPRKSGGAQRTPAGHQRDARAYIRPLGNAHCPTPAAQKQRSPRDTSGTPEGRHGVHPTPWQHIVPRLPRKSSGAQGTPAGRQRDAMAYIRPLGSAHCPTPATQKQRSPRDTRGMPEGRQGVHPSAHCPTPATQKQRSPRDTRGTPEGRQGVHPTPWRCTLSHACHAKAA